MDVFERVFGEDTVFGLAKDEADGGGIAGVAELGVHRRAVEIHFAGILRLEVALFQIHNDEAAQVQMVEKEVEVKLAVADRERVLAADEGEAATEFEQEFLDVGDEAGLQFALLEGFGEGEEVEEVRVLEQALGEAGVKAGQRGGEVRDGGPLAFVGAVFDLEDEGVTGPARLQSLAGVPKARGQLFELLDEDDIVRPAYGKRRLLEGVQRCRSLGHSWSGCGQWGNGPLPNGAGRMFAGDLGNGRLPKFEVVGIGLEKLNHQFDVPLGESLFLGEFIFQIHCEPRDDACAPALVFLPRGDQATDVPIEENHLGVGRECGAVLGSADAGFDIGEKTAVDGDLLLHNAAPIFLRWASTLAASTATSRVSCGNGVA